MDMLDFATRQGASLDDRLIYADWLEDQGDWRAEYVRLLVEQSRTPANTAKYWQLGDRGLDLRLQHRVPLDLAIANWCHSVAPPYVAEVFLFLGGSKDGHWMAVHRRADVQVVRVPVDSYTIESYTIRNIAHTMGANILPCYALEDGDDGDMLASFRRHVMAVHRSPYF